VGSRRRAAAHKARSRLVETRTRSLLSPDLGQSNGL
jgi:hypothetical protein